MSVLVACGARAASLEDRVETLFRPLLGEMMALSPDGQRVAYTARTGDELAIVMFNAEHPGAKRTVVVEQGQGAAATASPAPGKLRFMRWASPDRLVYAPVVRVLPLPPITDKAGRSVPNPSGPTVLSPIMATDADGRQRGTLVDARDFQETPAEARRSLADFLRTTKELQATRSESVHWRMPHLDILGFFPRDREQIIIQTRGAYSMPMQHMVDIRTGHVQAFGDEWPAPPGEPQVYDWFRLKVVGERKSSARPLVEWRDDELGKMQRELEKKFPRRSVELLDWSETRARVLVRVTGGGDPGRIFIYQRTEDVVVEILRRAPWLSGEKLHETRWFECMGANGAPLNGWLTWPGKPRVNPPPLLVVFPSGFPDRAQPAFDPEAHVFADLGFAVARLNHRGVAGVRPEDHAALRAAIDRVGVDDALAVIESIAARNPDRPFDRKRVAAIGRGFGGYLAVRALQLEPAVFRCGIAIDAPLELHTPEARRDLPAGLLDWEGAEWKKFSVVERAEALSPPVLFLVEPARNPAADDSLRELQARLKKLGRTLDYLALDPGFATEQPAARSSVYRRIEEFLTVHLHGFAVKIGPPEEVP